MRRVSLSASLIAALCLSVSLLLLPGCASKQPQGPGPRASERIKELRDLVRDEVDDSRRAEAMLAVLDRANAEVERHAQLLDEQMEAINESSQQYDTTRRELETMLNALDDDTMKILDSLEKAHFEMKALATEEEWASIVGRERKVLGIF